MVTNPEDRFSRVKAHLQMNIISINMIHNVIKVVPFTKQKGNVSLSEAH